MSETSRLRLAGLIIAIIILIFIAAYSVSASPTPTPFDASKIDYSQFTPEEIAKTEAHRNELNAQLSETLKSVGQTANDQGASLERVQEALVAAQASFTTYQMAVESQLTKANQAIAALNHVLAKLHLAKWIMCGLWIAAVAFLAMKIPPPLSLYVGGGAAVAGVAAIWMFL